MNLPLQRNVPNFSLIKFISAENKGVKEQVDLTKLFDGVINGKSLEVYRHHLEYIFRCDLTIDIEKLDKQLCEVLYQALIYYVTQWSGWQRISDYQSGELQSKEWFERFRQYLIFKSNFIIKNSKKYSENKVNVTEIGTQIDVPAGKKAVSPYSLIISGTPSVLNSVAFIERAGTDVLIKQHTEKVWQNLDLQQFLNWPHVSVEVKLPDVSLTRSNCHMFDRSVCLIGDKLVAPDVNHIVHITKMADIGEKEVTPYTHKFFFYYFLQLRQVLSKISDICASRLNELVLIFTEFVNDIKEVDIYNTTMATYVTVGFNVGGSRYVRNKKMMPSNRMDPIRNTINFYEIIIPQIDVSLNYFKAVQDLQDKENITFESLNLLLIKLSDPTNPDLDKLRFLINNTCITYTCTMCSEYYSSSNAYEQITKHFKDKHKHEQSVICYKCKKQFEIKLLAEQRWSHNCKG